MFTPKLAHKGAFGLLALLALVMVATGPGSPSSVAAPASLPQYVADPAPNAPLITPTPTPEPEYIILRYVKDTYYPTCSGPIGTPGHRYLNDCYPFGNFSHPTDAYVDRYASAGEAQAAWLNRRDNVCPTYPICFEGVVGGYRAYEAGNTAYPYAHYEVFWSGGTWLMGAVSSDDTHFRGAPPVANAVMSAALNLGYLPPGTHTPQPTVSNTPTVWPTATSGAIYDLTGTAGWSSVCPDTVLRATTHFQASASVIANNSVMRIENSAGDTRNLPVPPLPANTSYSYDCVLGTCVPSDWAAHLPITLTVDVLHQVIESNENNNTYVVLYPPPMPTPCNITPTNTPTNTPTCSASWQQVPSPNASAADNYLLDVSAIAANDVWAVGYYSNTVTQRYETLIQHWDGSAWAIVPSPNPAGWHNYLRAVDGVASNDVWAVGDGRPNVGYGGGYLLTLHWDGTQWTAVPNPNPGYNYANGLGDVVALASNDVWAAGMWRAYSFRGLLMHWDGSAWVQEIDPFFQGSLSGISGVASNDLWAVGQELSAGSLVDHRDSSGWSRIPSPEIGGVRGVSAVASNDVWAVGEDGIIRWNGASWITMTAPIGGLLSVDARTANDVWVVATTAILHWNGSQWTIRPTSASEMLVSVDAVAAGDIWAVGTYLQGGVRRTLVERYTQGGCQTVTPTPPVTHTPTATATSTIEPEYAILQRVKDNHPWLNCVGPLGTPGHRRLENCIQGPGHAGNAYVDRYGSPAEAQAAWQDRRDNICPTYPLCVDYSDRSYQGYEAGNTNYPYAHHENYLWGSVWLMGAESTDDTPFVLSPPLAREIIDAAIELGYLSGGSPTVTPTATQTPNVPPPTCTVTFQDVPPDNTFYPFVRCLACQGIVSGYPCGGQGEPCDGGNHPYFRPNNYVTRGQLAKIVSESAGFEDEVPPSQWTFADVPYGSTFWLWVERLHNRDVMSGYPCGQQPHEPCDTENRPYFRPNTGATRGQMAKIMVNAAGFTKEPPGTCTFADTCGTTFGRVIEMLVFNRPGSISGYPCGTVLQEPCDSENRPYFRPNNPLTRGQTSKVAANVFFPGCNPP